MPTPTPSWDLVRLYGTWNNLDGTKKAGAYTVTIPQRVTSATDDVIIPPGVYASGKLNVAAGPSLDIMVPTTNDPDVMPQNWSMTVTVSFVDRDAPTETFYISPSITGGPINLRTIVLPSNAVPPADALFRGVAGGVAALDKDGDVVNAAGTKITGGGGSSGPIPSTQISDSTATGRNVLSAASKAAARSAIDAALADATSTVTGAGTARTLSAAQNFHDLTLNANCTITLPSVTPTTPPTPLAITLLLRQDATGGRTVTLTPTPTWLGSAVSYATAPAAVTVLSLFSLDNGASWYGTQIGTVAGSEPASTYDVGTYDVAVYSA